MYQTAARNREILRLRNEEKQSLRQIGQAFGLSQERVRRILIAQDPNYGKYPRVIRHSTTSLFDEADRVALKSMVAKYSLVTVMKEFARIVGNYGNTSPKWARVAKGLWGVLALAQR